MLNKPVDEIVMEGGHVVGVKSEGEVRDAGVSAPLLPRVLDSACCCRPPPRWLAASSSSATPATFRTASAKRVR